MATKTSATTYSAAVAQPQMDKRLLEAATSGDSRQVKELVSRNPSFLHGTTPQGNSCLHISSMHGHKEFCEDVLEIEESLLLNANFESFLSKLNLQGETPLVTAVTHGHAFVASFLVGRCHRLGLRQVILQQDKTGCNALHHAIHSGHKELALELIAAEPALSRDVNKFKESPLFLAVMRDFCDVVEKLVRITDSAHGGQFGFNALHGAVRNDNPVIARQIMETRPELAREGNTDLVTPIRMAVRRGKIRVVRELLRHDFSLGYEMHKNIFPLLNCAAAGGQVNVAQEILRHCPDAPYREIGGETRTCLHIAVLNNHIEFVEFILSTPYLRKLVNMQDNNRKTALHYAVQGCYPKIIAALLSHEDIDRAVLDNSAKPTAWELWINTYCAKSINWNNVWMLKLKGRPRDTTCLQNIHGDAKQGAINESSRAAKSVTRTYTANTLLVAILMATITLAAAFTVPVRYKGDAGSEGLAIISRKIAYQAFLISDALATCSSFAVALICTIARWGDHELLIQDMSFTKKLMWFAYVATATACSAGLYAVMAPRLHWLTIAPCLLVLFGPFLLGTWADGRQNWKPVV